MKTMRASLRHLAASRCMFVAVGIAVATTAVAPAAARAGTVLIPETTIYRDTESPVYVAFRAAAGETNRVTLTSTEASAATSAPAIPQRWTFRDTGAPLTAGRGCEQVDTATVACAPKIVDESPWVSLSDGNDEFTSETDAKVFGGDGDDTIRFAGDVGSSNNAGRYYVHGGAGNDLIDAALGGDISADGGKGGDLLIGSVFGDHLMGGPGPDELRGGDGYDRLIGGTGIDQLTCGQQEDTVSIDRSDHLVAPNTPTPELGLGLDLKPAGREQTFDELPGQSAELQTDCETLDLAFGDPPTTIHLAEQGRLTAGVLALGTRAGVRRPYELQLRDSAGRLLGRANSFRRTPLKIVLTGAGIAALQPGTVTTVRLLRRPAGAKGAGPRTKPGMQLDLTIGT